MDPFDAADRMCAAKDVYKRQIFGDTVLTGTGEYEGHEYKVWYKNEHLVSYLDGKVDICAPDLICVIDNNTGMPVTNPNYENGMDLSVFVLPDFRCRKHKD